MSISTFNDKMQNYHRLNKLINYNTEIYYFDDIEDPIIRNHLIQLEKKLRIHFERASFDDIKFLIKFNYLEVACRIPSVQDKLIKKMEKTLFEWKTVGDFIRAEFFGKEVKCRDGKLFSDGFNGLEFSLVKNQYPYNIEDNVEHYVLWMSYRISMEIIDKIIKLNIKNCEYVFQNHKPDNMTIPEVFHVHVFVRKSN